MFGDERNSYCNKIQIFEEKVTRLEQLIKQKEKETVICSYSVQRCCVIFFLAAKRGIHCRN